ncbi:response regulator transcription factor [Mycobacterium malmoense]|uniref:response regulator n=1 Tax=Mycobacterium malmoense TaxID=1780 RepID=UPI0009F4E7FA|nr:response regulator transcription factor [Mycobacterium malmoense]QZA18255.1 response regulator transcription factor [Mycobacterium malmoense]UNB95027.1 response regulator transcription factor [Mycobacterium malmoense]
MDNRRPRITVVVADDHNVFRRGVVRALNGSEDLEVVGEVGDGHAALRAIRDLRPTVALLDYRMPGLDGLEVLSAVAGERLPTRVLLLSAFDDDPLARRALLQGACGYLNKESDRSEIVRAVIKCAAGAR